MSMIDILSLITGLICVYMIVKENDWNWWVGVANSALLLVVFLQANLYAQVGLQAIYLIEGVFGWFKWIKKDKDTNEKAVIISKANGKQGVAFTVIGIIGVAVLTYIFKLTADPMPFLDSLITVASIIAELMLCWKLKDSWIIYMITDVVSIGLYIYLGLHLTAVTYVGFLILCIMGWKRWTRIYKKRENILQNM